MDPVTISRLLDSIEAFVYKNQMSKLEFQHHLRLTPRRCGELLRTLSEMQLVALEDEMAKATKNFTLLVECWERADLSCINTIFKEYSPYARFLKYLEEVQVIKLPHGDSIEEVKANKTELSKQLKKNVGLNFVAFDNLQSWAIALGVAHRSENSIVWGGNQSSRIRFREALLEKYEELRGATGYAQVGLLADEICVKLRMSIPTFREYFRRFYEDNWQSILTSGAVEWAPSRRYVLRFLSKLGSPLRFWTWSVEDGFDVRKDNVKLIKVVQPCWTKM